MGTVNEGDGGQMKGQDEKEGVTDHDIVDICYDL